MKKLPKTGNLFSPTEHFRKSSLMTKITSAFLVLFLCAFQLSAQEHRVSGTVTDPEGVSLPGVNVIVEGTTIGAVTDVDGQFSFTAPAPTSILVISYVGYARQRVAIEGRDVVDVVLQPELRAIDEIVVVGYGTRMREELTGSVSTLSGDRMEISTAPSTMGRIQGQVSGVTVTTANTPGGDATVRVRGLGTINDANPLYIIDGVPAGPGNNLNPNDIESISILKDASSAAIYGTRGANGVIIITTKRGREGQRPQVNFNVRTGITQAVNQYDLLNTAEYGEMLWLEARNRGLTPGVNYSHPQYGDGAEPRIPNYILPAGAMSVDHGLYRYPDFPIFEASVPGTNWYDEIYRNGFIQEYDMSVTGGGENVTYSFSGSYLNEEGMLIHTGFERFTFRNTADARFNNWLKAGQSVQVINTSNYGNLGDNSEGIPISQAYRSQPIIPVYDIEGNFAGSRAPGMGNSGNPVAMLYRARNDGGDWFRILGNIFAEADLYEGLSFRSTMGYNYGQWNGWWANIANFEHSEPNRIDGFNRSNNYSLQWNWSNTLNYAASFGDDHRLAVILGTEAIDNNYRWMNASRSQYFSTDVNYMQLSSGEINQANSGSASSWSLFSIFGRVNYDLMGRYLFEATVRRDGSSRFGADNRYANFPAASFAWAFSQEDFMAGTRGWLDFGKVRLGWGVSGNDRIGNYNIFSTYGTHIMHSAYAIDGSNTSSQMGFQPSAVGNPGVTWETTETVNLGLDMTLFNSTVNFSIDGWQRYTSDMLYQLSVPQVMGIATPPFVNIGEMKNTGFDIELGYNNTAMGGQFRYAVSGTLSRYVNELMQLSDDVEEYLVMGWQRQMSYTRATVGTAFPEFYGYIVDGIFQTQAEADAHPPFGDYNAPGRFKYRDVNGDGEITPADMQYIGSPHPDFTGGLNIDLGYGNFDLNMFFYGSYGNDMINYVRRWIDFGMFNGGKSHDALYNSWGSPYVDNAQAKLPIHDLAEGSQQPSTHFVEDGSFLRMKNLRIGYRLPQELTNRMQIQNVRIYGQVTNLFTITNYSGLDPELNTSGGSMGMDMGAWPTPRQIMFGVSLGL
ncbi:MAG: TonB-dependent receptor [Marinilabiliales bacterium]|nr:MAG: TonB-dependent receptor [Marinilabiliales bacterium]